MGSEGLLDKVSACSKAERCVTRTSSQGCRQMAHLQCAKNKNKTKNRVEMPRKWEWLLQSSLGFASWSRDAIS